MDTAPLKSFATSARTELIREVGARITAVLAQGAPERVEQPRVVTSLEHAVARAGGGEKGKAHVADKVAYMWFNRIIALRFMDANGYTGIGVVSPAADQVGQPEVLAAAKRGQVDSGVVKGTNAATITGLLNGTRQPRPGVDAQAEAYALLLAGYCRYWNRAMPFIFEREGDYTELLIPANLLAEDSVLSRSVKVLTEDVCHDVEIIGWLYQFYISERKGEVFAGFKRNKKAGADEIPAATQLFTPDWIVRYLVENSVGRLWMLNHPESHLIDQMDYYIAPVDEETDFLKITTPEELKVIDPACGSGHMLTYAFDLLYAIYEEEGYTPSQIPSLILTHNLYGTEIDPRAGALAAFALTMKAAAKRKLFLRSPVEPNICVLTPISISAEELSYLVTEDGDQHAEEAFWNQFAEADTRGSLIRVHQPELIGRLTTHLDGLNHGGDLYKADALEWARKVIAQAEYLTPRYSVAVANPPYMGSGNMDGVTAAFARSDYNLAKTDLYAMFIERCLAFVAPSGTVAMVTQDSWMFVGAYAKYRDWLLRSGSVLTLAHLGSGAFDTIGGEVVSTVAFTLKSALSGHKKSVFVRAIEVAGNAKAAVLKSAACGDDMERVWARPVSDFLSIPNTPLIYWATDNEISMLSQGPRLSELIQAREGLTTGSNDMFLRRWFEVSIDRIGFGVASSEESAKSGRRWFPYQKGGSSRRWYGNFDFVVDWEDDGVRQRQNVDPVTNRVRSHNYNGVYGFRRGFTWSSISGDGFAVRHVEGGFMFDTKGPMAFANRDDDLLVIEGFLNSSTATRFMRLLAPRLDFKLGHVLSLPIRVTGDERVVELVNRCISLARQDWDASEMSPDFSGSPIVGSSGITAHAVDTWLGRVDEANNALAKAEQELDSIFDEAYGASSRDVERTDDPLPQPVRVRGTVEDFVSYAVGCMFGRYSLDEPGLILADQGATLQDYLAKVPSPTFTPDADNVIPIVEGDWFEDDIVERFRHFLRVAFGEQHFEENLRFITKALGMKNLRDFFVKSFYKDHVQRYKKRPIYWLFSSPKGSFNALIYMHRYTPSTVSAVLTYLREYVTKLESALQQAERAGNAKESDRLRKILVELNEYEHDTLYPKASENIVIDLDDGVKANYPKFGAALKKIPGLEVASD